MSLVWDIQPYGFGGALSNVNREMNRLNHMVDEMLAPVYRDVGEQVAVGHNRAAASYVNDKHRFAVNVDVSQFAPEEITIRSDDKTLTIEGKHEERRDEHGFISRQFVRKFAIPEDVDAQQLKSNLDRHGLLTIDAPKKALESKKDRHIPIQYTTTTSSSTGPQAVENKK